MLSLSGSISDRPILAGLDCEVHVTKLSKSQHTFAGVKVYGCTSTRHLNTGWTH